MQASVAILWELRAPGELPTTPVHRYAPRRPGPLRAQVVGDAYDRSRVARPTASSTVAPSASGWDAFGRHAACRRPPRSSRRPSTGARLAVSGVSVENGAAPAGHVVAAPDTSIP